MKKIVAIWLLALLPLFGIAQPLDARQRTAETIVADALAQLPVSTPALFDEVMGEIAATGSRGVEMVASMFVPAAEGKNTTLEYALNGVVCYASAPGREALLPEIREGLVAALAQEGDTAKRSFLISQLQLCGTAEEAAALLPALDDPALADYALRALVSIPGTEELLLSLARQEGLTTARRCALARAFADKGTAAAEPVLTAWAAGADEELKAALWPALARCGTASSLRLLGEAAAAVGYAAEPTEATESYLVLLERCAAAGDAKPVAKAARKLLACDRQYVRGAALRLLVLTQGVRKSMPLLLKAIGEGPAEYRFAAFDVLGAGDDELFARLTAAMPRWNAGAQAALLCWLGERHATSQSDVIARSIASPDPEIAAAAIDAATHIGDEQTLTALVGALEGPLSAKAEAALLHFNGKIDGRMEELLHRDEPQVLVAALRLTGARRLTACADRVFELLDAPQPEVADAACATLAQVARPGDAGRIAAMLDTADATRVGGLQEALHAALLPLSAEERCARIEAFMEASPAGERYYPVLARTDTPQAVARLLERFRADGSEAAFDALLLVNTPQMIDTLYALAAEHPALADRALGRYAELTARFRTTPVRLYQQTRRALALEASDATRSRLLTNLLDVQAYPALVLAASYLENEGTAAAAAAGVKNLVAKSSPMPGGADIRAALEKAREVYRKLAQSDADAGYAVDEITGLLGRLPETGFVALPTDPAQWQPVADSPASGRKLSAAAAAKLRRSAETALRENWTGRDGMLLYAGKSPSTIALETPRENFELWLEWRSQGEAGLGVRSLPLVRLGGAGTTVRTADGFVQDVPASDNAAGEWNTLYVKVSDDRITVVENGVTVVGNRTMENLREPGMPVDVTGTVWIAGLGSPVELRDMWLRELPSTPLYELSEEERAEGFELLFDGRSLHKWTGNKVNYVPLDGTIDVTASYGGGGNLYTKKEYGDFVLRFEFRFLHEAVNNGIGIRTPMGVDAAFDGMEIQVLDHDAPIYRDLHAYQQHGSVYGVIAAKRVVFPPLGEWNVEEIRAVGDRITVTVNGEVILDGNIREACQGHAVAPDGGTENPYMIDHRNHPGLFNKRGHIAFCGHGAGIQFRRVRILDLSPEADAK